MDSGRIGKFEEGTTVDTHYPEVDKLSFEFAPKKQEPEMVEPDDQNRNPDEKDDLTAGSGAESRHGH